MTRRAAPSYGPVMRSPAQLALPRALVLCGAGLGLLAVAAPPAATALPEEPAAESPCGVAPPGMACVPGGPFLRGSDEGPDNERPRALVSVSTFYMDLYEVTVERWERCVAERKCKRVRTIYDDYSRPAQPKVGVSWFDAVAYCRAHGKHLPTEAEWEKAARGTDGRAYPWGDEPATCERAVIEDARGRSCGVRKAGSHPDKGRTFEVGTRPATVHGLYDMAGNSWEWVHDWISRSYEACGAACRGRDPRGPCDGAARCKGHHRRVVRGGSWYWPASYATTTYRRAHVPSNDPYHHFGFRCAASMDEAALLAR